MRKSALENARMTASITLAQAATLDNGDAAIIGGNEAAAADLKPTIEQEISAAMHDPGPPLALSLTPQTRALCRRVGIRFDGDARSDVLAYHKAEGWIETEREGRLYGKVEPYWRFQPYVRASESAEVQAATMSAADIKRARKAAKAIEIASRAA